MFCPYNINLYPNPSHDFTELDFSKTSVQNADIQLYTFSGKLVSTYDKEKGDDFVFIKLEDQPNGLYFVKIDFDGRVIYKKIMKE